MADRKTRSKEERIAELDAKIKYHMECIEALKTKKERVLNPEKRKSYSALFAKAQEAGLTEEQIAEKLGITL